MSDDALEPRQRSEQLRVPLPRRQLGPGVNALLWAMRVYVTVAVAVVAYAFVRALQSG